MTKNSTGIFGGPIDSEKHNRRMADQEESLRELATQESRLASRQRDVRRHVFKDHISMGRMVQDLKDRIAALEGEQSGARTFFFSRNGEESAVLDTGLFDGTSFAIAAEDRLQLDGIHGHLHLDKVESASRSRLIATTAEGREVLPTTLRIKVEGDETTAEGVAEKVDSNHPHEAVKREVGTVWERNVVCAAPHEDGSAVWVYVKLPEELNITNKANRVVLHMFPQFGVTLEAVEISGKIDPLLQESDVYTPINSDGDWSAEARAIGDVPPGGFTGDEIANAGALSFHFPERDVHAIRFKLTQNTHDFESDKFVYTYGLSRLDVLREKFASSGTAMVRVDAPDGGTISSVDQVEPLIFNLDPVTGAQDAFSYRVIWETSYESGQYTTTPQPNSQRVWVEVSLDKAMDTTPVLSGLRVVTS